LRPRLCPRQPKTIKSTQLNPRYWQVKEEEIRCR
jgi:hypothetical protein